ncbi:SLBB domain-containing protein [Pseudanabaena mucicola]|uniref:SLBB domain-containing protein n=1 Tax=Pseudanabaena mucicola FACHB-723 TaxID=2692860 RepID=A0ABR8A174_9CYAN|nr:SLBB domain-containing protein [Pseudanabaena mucicola]MBD2189981.1 SLBB domain-containing protein [Pseudanabaena mucicola FACHB-723]
MHTPQFSKLIIFAALIHTPLPLWAQDTTIDRTSPPNLSNPSNSRISEPLNRSRLNVSAPQDTFRYILGAGDNIKIDVFNVPELSGTQTIAPDGTINISLIGAVKLEGLGIDEATTLLREKLNPFLVRNIVNISLVTPRPLNIAIVGEVNRPGPRFLNYGSSGINAATLTRALESASGITSRADISNIQISRRNGSMGRQIITINLQNLLERGDISQDIRILDGDSILVPPLAEASASQTRLVSNSTFSPDSFTIQVAIVGEVNRVGPQTLIYSRNGTTPTGLTGAPTGAGTTSGGGPVTLSRALQAANGVTEIADIRNVQISRLNDRGERTIVKANLLDLITKADLSQDVTLTDGDLITIPRLEKTNPTDYLQIAKATFSPTVITVQVVGEAVRPGPLQLRPNSSFTEAISFAGGLTNDADWRAVELYRVNPDGSIMRRDLVADLNLPLNEDSNPGLRDRDVIVIRPSFGASILGSATRFLGNIVTPFSLVNNLFRR